MLLRKGKQIVKMQKIQQMLLIAGAPGVSHSNGECTLFVGNEMLFGFKPEVIKAGR